MAFLVPVERAALNALAAWLTDGLPDETTSSDGVTVITQWPDADYELPARAVSIVFSGERRDVLTEIVQHDSEVIHDAISNKISVATATDITSACAVLNACKSSFNTHAASTSAHTAVDSVNAITSPNATDQASAFDLASEFYQDLPAHFALLMSHPVADEENAPTGSVANTTQGIIDAAEAVRRALNRHYAAKVFIWRARACEQPVQLDVWATYEDGREDIVARLEPLLNASTSDSVGFDDDMVRNGVLVQLGDGFTGYADFLFDRPLRTNNSDSQKRAEFRATYAGVAEFWLTIRKQSARMARIALAQLIDDTSSATASVVSSTSGTPTETITTS